MTEPKPPRKRPTPIGTWPFLISGALLLLLTPAFFLTQVVPQWLAIAGAFLFLAAAVFALGWSYLLFTRHRGTKANGVPIAGVIVGAIIVVAAGLGLVPFATS